MDAPTPLQVNATATYHNDMGHYEPVVTFDPEVTESVKGEVLSGIIELSWSATVDYVQC